MLKESSGVLPSKRPWLMPSPVVKRSGTYLESRWFPSLGCHFFRPANRRWINTHVSLTCSSPVRSKHQPGRGFLCCLAASRDVKHSAMNLEFIRGE